MKFPKMEKKANDKQVDGSGGITHTQWTTDKPKCETKNKL